MSFSRPCVLGALLSLLVTAACGDDAGGGGDPDSVPDTTISGDTALGASSFSFTSDTGTRFECQLDGGAFVGCASPLAITVTAGDHTFAVRALDDDGDVDASPASRGYRGVTGGGGATRLRLVAANLTSGGAQSYDPGHGGRILAGLKPDVVMIQEFNYGTNSATDLQGWVTSTFGAGYTYFREPQPMDIPNGVISRYPILASGKWEDTESPNREFVWTRLDVPGTKDLWAVSVHFLTDDANNRRNNEATQLVGYINANVPAGDYLVIGGDLNTDVRNEAPLTTLGQVVNTSGPPPVDQAGDSDTNSTRTKPYDWVMLDPDLKARQVPVVIGANSFANGLVFDSRLYSPLADVAPAMMADSDATGMQHMAVVVDVSLPN